MAEVLAHKRVLVRNERFCWERAPDHPDTIRYSKHLGTDLLSPQDMREMLGRIDCEGLLKPREEVSLASGSALLFDDFPGDPLDADLAPMTAQTFLPVARQMASSLGRIHTAGYVHNYVCPDAVLYDSQLNSATLFRFERLRGPDQSAGPMEPLLSDPQQLQFISPEGTGRTGNSVDNRSDLYSLGAVFYFMATGLPPFPSSDALATIHGHLAVAARNPSLLNPKLPEALSAVILKLLAKQPEDRYQGVYGLIRDLEFLSEKLERTGSLEDLGAFTPGERDQRGTFQTPTALFGRDKQLAELDAAAFEQTDDARSATVFVAGESGAGKTTLIHAFGSRWRERAHGSFVYGKFDTVVQSPYQAILQALADFATQVLNGSPAAISTWRSRILEATPTGARLFAELVPEFAALVGDLPGLEELATTERDSRFKLAVHDLFLGLATAESPLLLCLDDLQWADTASLEVLERVLGANVTHLTFVGAYRSREEEINPTLQAFLNRCAGLPTTQRPVRLDRLNVSQVHDLLIGSFAIERTGAGEAAAPVDVPERFAQLVSDKTEGNPLFVSELLERLSQRWAFWYDELEGTWHWDLDVIQNEAVSGGVAALLQGKLERLSPETRAVLRLASCIGYSFEAGQLQTGSSMSGERIQRALEEAGRLGLIHSTSDTEQNWAFAHDQLRERVYLELTEPEKETSHYRLGRAYMYAMLRDGREDLLFQAMNHLLVGQRQLRDADLADFIRTAMAAVEVAKRTAAYDSALTYLEAVERYLEAESWESRYAEKLDFALARLEAYYLNHRFEEANEAAVQLLAVIKEPVDRAKVYRLRVITQTFLMQYDKAIEAAIEGLADLGIKIPRNLRIALPLALARTLLAERRIDLHHLDKLPPISDAKAEAALRLLFDVAPAAFLRNKVLSIILGLEMFHLMEKHGINAYGLYGVSYVSTIHAVILKNYRKGWEIANSVLAMRDRFPTDSSYKSNFLLAYSTVLMWSRTPYEQMLPLINEGLENSQRAAQVTFTGYYADILLQLDVYMGRSIKHLADRRDQYQQLSRRLQFRELEITLEITGRFVHFLTDTAPEQIGRVPLGKVDDELESRVEDVLEQGFFYLDYLFVALIFCDRKLGDHCLNELGRLPEFRSAGHHRAEWLTLACIHLGAVAKSRGDRNARTRIKKYRRELTQLAELGVQAHGHRAPIANAELAALDGDFSNACRLYQEALEASEERGILHVAGIIAERAAQLCDDAGLHKQRNDYLTVSYRHFDDYGASAKTSELAKRHPELFGPTDVRQSAQRPQLWGSVDADAVTLASKVLFEEVEMAQLVSRLLVLSMETAGATKGCLFVDTGESDLGLASEAWVEEGQIKLREDREETPIENLDASAYPLDLVRTVVETGSVILVDDVSKEHRFELNAQDARSIICLPIVDRGKHHAALYLENNLTSSAFTTERIMVLEVLLSLAAISMTNARLYAQQENSLQLERRARESLAKLSDLKDEFLANTSHELRTPLNGIIGLADSMLSGQFGTLSDAAKANLNLIVGSGRRLASLVNDILDFTRLQKRELLIHPKSVDVEAMVSLVCRLLSADAERLGKRRLVNDVPTGITVFVDENRLQQILFNLIGNAMKFTDVDGTIRLEADVEDDFAIIRVIDDGTGISKDDLSRIFKTFEQVDASTERKAGGTGLGLPLTRQLVELHGGKLDVTSEPGVGSVFTFSLPLSKSPADELDAITIAHVAEVEPDTTATMQAEFGSSTSPGGEAEYTVLAVDDEPVNLRVLENYLGSAGYRVICASSGAECLRLLESGVKVDAILLDVMMPRMDGYETCRQIRRKHSEVDLPVILLTAKNRIEDLQAGFDAGANDYIPKPFARQELISRMRTHLNLAKMSTAFSRFVPLEIVEFLNKESILDVQLGDNVPMELTVMFMDIRSYTTLAEGMTPDEAFGFLITLFQRVGPIIEDNNGLVNQFLGDGFMALFPGSPDDAVTASIRVQKEVQRFNAQRRFNDEIPITVGIGLHTGEVILGIIGDKYRRSGNVISDAVNLASRVEGLTKTYGAKIAASSETLSKARHIDHDAHRMLDEVRVKGRATPVVVHEIFAGDDDQQLLLKRETRDQFEHAVRLYREERFLEAQQSLKSILARNPEDRAAALLLQRCEYFAEHGVPMNWGGIEELQEK